MCVWTQFRFIHIGSKPQECSMLLGARCVAVLFFVSKGNIVHILYVPIPVWSLGLRRWGSAMMHIYFLAVAKAAASYVSRWRAQGTMHPSEGTEGTFQTMMTGYSWLQLARLASSLLHPAKCFAWWCSIHGTFDSSDEHMLCPDYSCTAAPQLRNHLSYFVAGTSSAYACTYSSQIYIRRSYIMQYSMVIVQPR